ncbi:MAG: long-chain-fatty-acid--CoA ligase [Verrucomicrobia bacterium]|nr:long-chain-fatty-acid--CoA ligase [Verrucomicrobiota bacterium]
MELYQLRYFVEVAREQSFTRAARRLNLATPALSLQIQNLEKEFGTNLLIRGQRQTVLTPAGEILFEKAQALLGMAESMKQSVVEVSELRAGKLTIAFIPALGTYWLADIFRSFRREYPCVNLVLQEETSLGVAALVEDSSTELGFLQLPCNNQLFEAREIWNEPFFAVLPGEHSLADKKSLELRQLQRDQFVVIRGVHQERTNAFCRVAGFEPQIVCECSEQETAISLVQAGLGVMLLPQLVACVLRDNVVAVPVREPKLFREIGLISRRGKELSAAARAFVDLVKKAPFPASASQRAPSERARNNVVTHSAETSLAHPNNDHSAPQGLLTPLKFLERSALVYRDKMAVKYNAQSWTYGDLQQRVNRLASALRNADLEPGDRVAFICSNVPAMLEAHFGVPLAGGVLVPINFRLGSGEIAYILGHSGSKFLFVDSEFSNTVRPILSNLEKFKQVVDIIDTRGAKPLGEIEYEEFLRRGNPKPLAWLLKDEDELISLNYTSGTTGKPKGVMVVHRGAYLHALGEIIEDGLTPQTKYLWTLPMFHCNGWCFTWAVSAIGGTHICQRRFDAGRAWQLILNEGVTHLSGAPNVMAALINHADRPKTLRQPLTVVIGGAQPSPSLIQHLQELGARVIHGYGLTETYGAYTVCEAQAHWKEHSVSQQANLLSRQGVPRVIGDPVRVVDENLRDVRSDGQTIGEVIMRGATVMKGYYKEPEATAKDFRGGWFHSGDLAVVHPDGYIELHDRLRDIIITGGENVSSNEIEQTLYTHPAVAEVAVVGVPHQKLGETAKAFVVIKDGVKASERELIKFCRGKLASFKIPTAIEFRPSLPRTSSGKIQKFLLREKEWAGHEKRIQGV